MSRDDDDDDGPEGLGELQVLIEELYAGLDTLPYHVYLGVPENALGDDLRAAFHARAQVLHPDRFYGLADKELRGRIYAVYKRVTEAYRVLGDPTARKRYEDQRAKGKIRLDPTATAPGGRPEDQVAVGARKFLKLAQDAERLGDLKAAKFNVGLALSMDPGNPFLLQLKAKYS